MVQHLRPRPAPLDAELRALLPLVHDWIDRTVREAIPTARAPLDAGFTRLPRYFDHALLATARYAVVDRIAPPPLPSLGIPALEEFLSLGANGMTFRHVYLLDDASAAAEDVHCHELVHVVQWQVLGQERFVEAYVSGLLAYGYRHMPLEEMAYEHQRRFDAGSVPYDIAGEARRELARLYG